MGLILGKSKSLKPKPMKEIRYIGHPEKNVSKMAIDIAKQFGLESSKLKPKKIIIR